MNAQQAQVSLSNARQSASCGFVPRVPDDVAEFVAEHWFIDRALSVRQWASARSEAIWAQYALRKEDAIRGAALSSIQVFRDDRDQQLARLSRKAVARLRYVISH